MGSGESKKLSNLNQDAILKVVTSFPVVIYTRPDCGYCKMAKDILQDEKIIYKDKNLDKVEFERTTDYDAYVNGLIYITRQKTVPQIFICGKFIGGYTELNKLKEQKRIRQLVDECSQQYNLTTTR